MLILSLIINSIFLCYIIFRIYKVVSFTKYFTNTRIVDNELKDIRDHLNDRFELPYEHYVGETKKYPIELVEKMKRKLIKKGFDVKISLSDNERTYLIIS